MGDDPRLRQGQDQLGLPRRRTTHAKAKHASEHAAESAGIIETIRTIHALTGLYIDHYMQVSLLGFYRISEAIGGVTVCLKHAQNATTDKDAFGSGYSGIDLPKGVSVIKGAQALAFVRQRHGLPHGDLDRIKRQQYFLRAAFAKITSAGMLLNPFKLHDLLERGRPLAAHRPGARPARAGPAVRVAHLRQDQLRDDPQQRAAADLPGRRRDLDRQVNHAAIPAFVAQPVEGRTTRRSTNAKPAAPQSVTVDVLNGTDVARLAARNAAALRKLGFRVDIVDSTDTTPSTAVEYPPGKEAQAKALLAAGAQGEGGRRPRTSTA